jgi:hypothetical protein
MENLPIKQYTKMKISVLMGVLISIAYYLIFLPTAYYAFVFVPKIETMKLEQQKKEQEAQEIIASLQTKITEQEQLIEKQKNNLLKNPNDASKTGKVAGQEQTVEKQDNNSLRTSGDTATSNRITGQEQLVENLKSVLPKTSSGTLKNSNTSAIEKSCNDLAMEQAKKRYQETYANGEDKYIEAQFESYYARCLRENRV